MTPVAKPRGRHLKGAVLATVALALLAVSPHAAIAAGPGKAPLQGIQTAIAPTEDLSKYTDQQWARMRDTGAGFVRLDMNWAAIAPATPRSSFDASNPDSPGYDWTYVTRQIVAVASHGLQPMVYIDNAPAWALSQSPVTTNIPAAAQLGKFAMAAALRFDGTRPGLPRVRNWAVFNEPNWSYYLFPQVIGGQDVAVGDYRDMVNAVAAAAHGVHPDNVVIAGELFPNGIQRGNLLAIAPLQFARELFCLSAGSNPHRTCSSKITADVISVHPYTSGGPSTLPAGRDNVWIATLPLLTRLVSQAQAQGTLVSAHPVATWVTEFAWNTNPPRKGTVPIALAQRWVAETLYKSWLAGVSVFTWFTLRDDQLNVSLFQAGLYYACSRSPACDQPKPTLTSFRFPFVAYRQSGRQVLVWGRTPPGLAGPARVQVRQRNSWVTLATLKTTAGGIFTTQLRLPASADPRNAVLRAQGSDRATVSNPFSLKRPPDIIVKPFV